MSIFVRMDITPMCKYFTFMCIKQTDEIVTGQFGQHCILSFRTGVLCR
jgi:hypothetical protein